MKMRVTTPAELDGMVASERAALAKMTAGASSNPVR
jgi:hypothetical protein